MQRAKFYGEVKGFVLNLDRLGLFEAYLKSLPEGQRVELTVEKESEETTNLQYAYLFGVVVAMKQ